MATVEAPDIVSTQAELAIALDVDERTVRRYVSEGMPGSRGCYSISESRDWISRNIKQYVNSADSGDLKEKRLRAEIRKLNADAESKEYKNAIMQGQLLYRDDVERQLAEAFLRVKTRMEALPDELETTFPAATRAQNKADFAEMIRLVLLEMAAFEIEASDE